MSLRFRLIGLVAVVLVISLAFGGVIAGFNASRSVRTEMRSALLVGRQTVGTASEGLQNAPDPERELENLITSFKGNRHLRVALTGEVGASPMPAIEPAADKMPFGEVPGWFVRMIGVPPVTIRVPITLAGRPYRTVMIETDPQNEILEVWNEFSDSLITLGLFCGLITLLIYVFTGRALKPLDELAAALEQVGHGAYGMRVSEHVATELAPLRDSFNRMVGRLAETDADNRRLNDQLLTLQEEERAELARDLHDEVGPFLFAINIDVANIARLIKAGRDSEVASHVQSITEAVSHLQQQVRSMLGRLRPVGLAEFGLAAAIENMVEFWRRRHGEIAFRLSIGPGCDALGELADTTIYRVVQECLSNAVRHGNPRSISIAITRRADGAKDPEASVVVTDDGGGVEAPSAPGFGLRGMAERVQAMGGRLTIGNEPGGGFAVAARLPCPPPRGALSEAVGTAGAAEP